VCLVNLRLLFWNITFLQWQAVHNDINLTVPDCEGFSKASIVRSVVVAIGSLSEIRCYTLCFCFCSKENFLNKWCCTVVGCVARYPHFSRVGTQRNVIASTRLNPLGGTLVQEIKNALHTSSVAMNHGFHSHGLQGALVIFASRLYSRLSS
jgi:hypothetical protein